MISAEELPFAPKWLGELMYPQGAPIRPENHSYGGRTIQELTFLRAQNEEWSKEEMEFVKQYIIYYANAPIFDLNPDNEYVKEMREKLTLDKSVDELIYICLEYGIDPL